MRHVMAERFEPFLGLEPDHVIGEQRLDQPAMIGQRDQQSRRRPGNVEEEPHPVGQSLLRSEEHTSELQSLMRISYAVFCLKKKTRLQTTSTRPRSHQTRKHQTRTSLLRTIQYETHASNL